MFFASNLLFAFAASAIAVVSAASLPETHSITLQNGCPFGVPIIVQNGEVVYNPGVSSPTDTYTVNGPIIGASIYLAADTCENVEGFGCTVVMANLTNAGTTGVAIYGTAPYGDSFPISWSFQGGCQDEGYGCTDCNFDGPTLDCPTPNTSINVQFCAIA